MTEDRIVQFLLRCGIALALAGLAFMLGAAAQWLSVLIGRLFYLVTG